MLNDLFEEDGLWEDPSAFTTSNFRPKNCSQGLDLPPLPRQASNLVGLTNLGAICYLNSLIQKDSEKEFTELFPAGQKREIYWSLQRLFSDLKCGEIRAASPEELTKSFGWTSAEELTQHDVQELNRILFDVLHRALQDTVDYNSFIPTLYRGLFVNQIICKSCSTVKESLEDFYDISLQVKGISGLEVSLNQLISFEELNGNNQYFCEKCDCKCDASKGSKIREFPPIMTFSLNRFELDYNTFDRKKLNDKFTFPLEFRATVFKEIVLETPEDLYDLKAIIIHRGGAYGGHYHAYIHDSLGEGNWDLEIPESFHDEPVPEEKTINIGIEKAFIENPKVQEKKTREEKDKERSKKQKQIEYNYDSCNFPIPYTDPKFQKGWFDFNDSSVTPIPIGRLQRQFGTANESAYMLVYVRRNYSYAQIGNPMEIPPYLRQIIKTKNELEEQNRIYYKNEEQSLEIIFQGMECFMSMEGGNTHLLYTDDINPLHKGFKLKLKFANTVEYLLNSFIAELGEKTGVFYTLEELTIIEVNKLGNGCCQLIRDLKSFDLNMSLGDIGIEHWSTWLFIISSPNITKQLLDLIDPLAVPISINLRFLGEEMSINTYKNITLIDFKLRICDYTTFPVTEQKLELVKADKLRRIDKLMYSNTIPGKPNTLGDLNFSDRDQLFITEKEEMELEEKNKQINKEEESKFPEEVAISTTGQISLLIDYEGENTERIWVSPEITLEEALKLIKSSLNIPRTEKCQDIGNTENKVICTNTDPDADYRLRWLTKNELFVKEEMGKTLASMGMQDGGIRLKIEPGKIPALQQIALIVRKYSVDASVNIYLKWDMTIKEAKEEAFRLLELEGELGDYTLYTTDVIMEDPCQALKKEGATLRAMKIRNGELLIIKHKDQQLLQEKIILHLHWTTTGMPEDRKYLGNIAVPNDLLLIQLKEHILEIGILPLIDKQLGIENLRVRERNRNLYYTRIYRELNKPLKKNGINQNTHIVCQELPHPEELTNKQILLYIMLRDIPTKSYSPKNLVIITYPNNKYLTYDDLVEYCAGLYGLQVDNISLCKFLPNKFEYFQLIKQVEGKLPRRAKKGKQTNYNNDLSKIPFFIKEGDIIGVRDNSQLEEGQIDDFQTEDHAEAKAMFESWRLDEQKAKKDKKAKNKPKEVAFVIKTDF